MLLQGEQAQTFGPKWTVEPVVESVAFEFMTAPLVMPIASVGYDLEAG
jgi:hypothetical protein